MMDCPHLTEGACADCVASFNEMFQTALAELYTQRMHVKWMEEEANSYSQGGMTMGSDPRQIPVTEVSSTLTRSHVDQLQIVAEHQHKWSKESLLECHRTLVRIMEQGLVPKPLIDVVNNQDQWWVTINGDLAYGPYAEEHLASQESDRLRLLLLR